MGSWRATQFDIAQPSSTYVWEKVSGYATDALQRITATTDSLNRKTAQLLDASGAVTQSTQYQAGRIRLLALGSGERLGGALAEVPTWREQGVDSEFRSSLGVVGARGLTREQVAFWENAFKRLTQSEEWKRALARTQSQPHFLGHGDSLKFYEAEFANMRPMIEAMKLGK